MPSGGVPRAFLIICAIGLLPCLYMAGWAGRSTVTSATGSALRFFGNGVNDIDRLKIRLDAPATPFDVAGDFTLEFWLKAAEADNPAGATCGVEDGWITGNIIVDRDIFGPPDRGDYGVVLHQGRIAFGISQAAGGGTTLCGATVVADGLWHHVAVTRRAADGRLAIFVDGALDAQGNGPPGDIGYRDGQPSGWPNSDPFLVIGAEKHDAGSAYPSYNGLLDEIRLSTTIRYAAPFPPPTTPFILDPATVLLLHLDEGGGATATNAAGPPHAELRIGGSPTGPVWTADNPFVPPAPAPTPCLSGCTYLPLAQRE